MTGYQYNGKLKGEADPWHGHPRPGPKPGYRIPAPSSRLPNDPRLKRDHTPVRPPYGNALRRFGCGTEAGVNWHKRRGEKPCDACAAARRAARQAGGHASGCGTVQAYRRHTRRGEPACQPCVEAFEKDRLQACGTMRGVGRHKKAREPLCDPCKAARREYRTGKGHQA